MHIFYETLGSGEVVGVMKKLQVKKVDVFGTEFCICGYVYVFSFEFCKC